MRDAVIAAVREVAGNEVLPPFLEFAHGRRADGSPITFADLAAATGNCPGRGKNS